ncbi:MAG: propionyl-CoA synthetase [Candidatus Azotimanducaceae bacterium]|jgi:propionyl-CoA synthetase
MDYKDEYEQSILAPEDFWRQKANNIEWHEFPKSILSKDANGNDRWFADGRLNTSYLALDHHVNNGRGEQTAIVYDSPVTNTLRKISYRSLLDMVAKFAGALKSLGVGKGDRVIIYMPMIPEAVVGMLACARLGAIHSVVFGGFAAKELATRIDDARPKVILSASCGIEFTKIITYKPLVDEARRLAAHKLDHHVILQRPECLVDLDEGELDWSDFAAEAKPEPALMLSATDPLYILYTSGTTGMPKGVVRDNGGHAVALNYSMQAIYGAKPGDVFWAASDVGWVVGHSYIVYAPLIMGCTSVLFEGKPVRTPDAGTFWRVIQDYKVNIFFTAPTGFRAIRKEDPDAGLLANYDVSSLRTLFVAGERTDPSTYHWLKDILKIPVVDHWWQTETGWPMASMLMGYGGGETKAGSASFPVPGYQIQILSEDHQVMPNGEEGDVVVKLPLPPGCLPTVWGDHQRYTSAYLEQHPDYFHTGDGGYIDKDGYLFIMGRTDDVINVAGHRLSTGEMEEIVSAHQAIAECAVIGIEDKEKGQIPLGLLILKDGVNTAEEQLQDELVKLVRKEIGAFANFRRAIVINRLPKTRSGKILRQTMRKIADGHEYETPATIDDPEILNEIADAFRGAKVGLFVE